MSGQIVWCFMHRILQVRQGRMLYLCLPIDSLGHCIRHANIKVFSEPNFPVHEQNPRTDTGKYISEKPRVLECFNQCGVFQLLAKKVTNY